MLRCLDILIVDTSVHQVDKIKNLVLKVDT